MPTPNRKDMGVTRGVGIGQSFRRENVFDPQFGPHGRNSRAGQVYVSRMVKIANLAMIGTDAVRLTRSVCRFLYRFLCTIHRMVCIL